MARVMTPDRFWGGSDMAREIRTDIGHYLCILHHPEAQRALELVRDTIDAAVNMWGEEFDNAISAQAKEQNDTKAHKR